MKVIAQWRKEKKKGCTDEYVLAVRRAITMFRYCWVFDESTKSIVNFTTYSESDNTAFDISTHLDPKPKVETALGIYTGNIT